jgi:hypothetical protein
MKKIVMLAILLLLGLAIPVFPQSVPPVGPGHCVANCGGGSSGGGRVYSYGGRNPIKGLFDLIGNMIDALTPDVPQGPQRGDRMNGNPHVIYNGSQWVPEPGYKWFNNEPRDYRVVSIQAIEEYNRKMEEYRRQVALNELRQKKIEDIQALSRELGSAVDARNWARMNRLYGAMADLADQLPRDIWTNRPCPPEYQQRCADATWPSYWREYELYARARAGYEYSGQLAAARVVAFQRLHRGLDSANVPLPSDWAWFPPEKMTPEFWENVMQQFSPRINTFNSPESELRSSIAQYGQTLPNIKLHALDQALKKTLYEMMVDSCKECFIDGVIKEADRRGLGYGLHFESIKKFILAQNTIAQEANRGQNGIVAFWTQLPKALAYLPPQAIEEWKRRSDQELCHFADKLLQPLWPLPDGFQSAAQFAPSTC